MIPQIKQPDFEDFWKRALEQLRSVPIQICRKKLDTPYGNTVTSWEISYNTHDDTWIDAHFSYPAGAEGKLPCVVYFHGGTVIQYAGETHGVPEADVEREYDLYRDYTHLCDFGRLIVAYQIYAQRFGLEELNQVNVNLIKEHMRHFQRKSLR